MGKTSIEWTDHSVNPIRARNVKTGAVGHYCEKISSGCAHCYAARLQRRFQMPEFPGKGRCETLPLLTERGTVQINHEIEVWLDQNVLDSVHRRRKPTKFFWGDMTDLFGSWVPDGWLVRILMTIYQTPWHTHQLLTKRPERMADFLTRWNDTSGEDGEFHNARGPEATRKSHPSGRGQLFAAMLETMGSPPAGCAFPTFDWMEGPRWWQPTNWLDHLWLGTSIENQAQADERLPHLLRCPAAVLFLSCEPLLGPVNLRRRVQHEQGGYVQFIDPITGDYSYMGRDHRGGYPIINWVIVGGESGLQARPMHPDWVRSLRDQCQAALVPFFFKQWGEWLPYELGPVPLWTAASGQDSIEGVHLPEGLTEHQPVRGWWWPVDDAFSDHVIYRRLGKHAAGRLLDGQEYNEFPQPVESAG